MIKNQSFAMKFLPVLLLTFSLGLVGSAMAAPIAVEFSTTPQPSTNLEQAPWGDRMIQKLAERKVKRFANRVERQQKKEANNKFGLLSVGTFLLFFILLIALSGVPALLALIFLGLSLTLGILGLKRDDRRFWSILGIVLSGAFILLFLFAAIFTLSVFLAF